MWEWCDNLKLGKSSAFVKRDIRSLPLMEAEFDADFFFDSTYSTKRQECWVGLVIEREGGAILAWENVQLPPPTVNNLANLLAHAMLRPGFGDCQRPRTIHLRDRPQWQEVLPHLRQLGMEVVVGQDLPWFDEEAIEWLQETKMGTPPSADEIQTALRKPFPERKRTWVTDVMALTEWSDAMFKGAYPSRDNPVPSYDPMTVVPIRLAAGELDAILTKTRIGKTKKLRPRLEAMAAEGKAIELDINDWSSVLLALCGPRGNSVRDHKHLLRVAVGISNRLAEALGIEPPKFSV
jgi:hypothetical protein